MESKEYPFYFYTEASIDLADDPQLMELMVRAGFEEVFIGIETPHEEGLAESGIVTAMVGVLTALRGTRLYQRLEQEGNAP